MSAMDANGINVGEENNTLSIEVHVALAITGCPCKNAQLIMMPCLCEGKSTAAGYCCGDSWQPGECREGGGSGKKYTPPSDKKTNGDNSDEIPADVQFGAPAGGWEKGGAAEPAEPELVYGQPGCTLTRGPRPIPWGAPFTLLLFVGWRSLMPRRDLQ
jgi:hypothetical protein